MPRRNLRQKVETEEVDMVLVVVGVIETVGVIWTVETEEAVATTVGTVVTVTVAVGAATMHEHALDKRGQSNGSPMH